jgi:hypothetical protein
MCKLVRLGEIYAQGFDIADIIVLPGQLHEFSGHVCQEKSNIFFDVLSFLKVAKIMVKKGMARSYPLVYLLIELILLILPEGMASVLFSYVYHKDRSAEQNR